MMMVSVWRGIIIDLSCDLFHFHIIPYELKKQKGEYEERIAKLRRIELGILIGLVLILALSAMLLLR